jgi:hypothetical protein
VITYCAHLFSKGRETKNLLQSHISKTLRSIAFLDRSQKNSDHFNMNQENIYDTTWIENLAMDEINMEESGVININDHLNPMRFLEEASINFMEDLKELFEIYVTRFNECRSNSNKQFQIKLFKISNTVNDFMLFRNSLKLVVARRSNDVITIGFLSNSGGLFAARLNHEETASHKLHEIRAHVGTFNNIEWRFNGEKVDKQALVKHYLSEFIRHSAR